jgi:hypothetical protein
VRTHLPLKEKKKEKRKKKGRLKMTASKKLIGTATSGEKEA